MTIKNILDLINKAVFQKVGRNLSEPEIIILKGTWQGFSYEQMAKPASKYTLNYLMRDVGRDLWKLLSEVLDETINKSNFKFVIQQRYEIDTEDSVINNFVKVAKSIIDWGEAPDTSVFYGREQELKILEICVNKNNDQLLAITGLKEVGKSFLAAKFVEQIKDNFQSIVWINCHEDKFNYDLFLKHLNKIWSLNKTNINKENNNKKDIISYIQDNKCILIFDNLSEQEQNQEISHLIELIREIALLRTKSYLLLTTIDIPLKIKHLFGTNNIGYNLSLSQYTLQEIEKILEKEKVTYQDEHELNWLYQKCNGGVPKKFTNEITKIHKFGDNLSYYKYTTNRANKHEQLEEIIEDLSIIEANITSYLCEKSEESTIISAPFNKLTKDIYILLQENGDLEKQNKINTREDLWIPIDSLQNKTIIKLNEKGEFQLGEFFDGKQKVTLDLLKKKLGN